MNEITIGCDLGDKTSALCLLLDNGSVQEQTLQTTPQAFSRYFRRAPCHVVVEVGQHSRWVSSLLGRLGHRVTVANPRQVRLITQSHRKSDRTDAETLARLGRADVKLLAPIRHRGAQAQADLAIARARDELVGVRTSLINMVRGMVKTHGTRLPRCSADAFHRRTRSMLPELLVPALQPVYLSLEQLHLQICALDRQLEQTAQRYPEVAVLTQVAGVGTLTALVFVLTLEHHERFASSRMVGTYLGLAPRRSQSGDSDPHLPISKAGDPLLRRLLVGSANYILGPFGKDCELRRFGQKLMTRGGKSARKRATVAVARKLAVLLHALWRNGGPYLPVAAQTPTAA